MQFDAEGLIRLRRVVAHCPAPCGTWTATVVERLSADESRYVSDLWRVPLDGTDPIQLTRGDSADRAPAFDGSGHLYFASNRASGPKDDAPLTQVWRFHPQGGEPEPVTDEPLGIVAFRVAGDTLAVLARRWPDVAEAEQRAHQKSPTRSSGRLYTRMPVRYWDHWLSRAPLHLRVYRKGAAPTDLTPAGLAHPETPAFDLSADGRWIALGQKRRGSDGIFDEDVRLFDVEAGTDRVLTSGDRTEWEQPHLSPDGRWLIVVANGRHTTPGFRPRVLKIDLQTDQVHPIAADWDVVPRLARFEADGKGLLVLADTRGHVPVWRLDLDGTTERLTQTGTHADPHRVGDALISIYSTYAHPPEVHRDGQMLASLSGWSGGGIDMEEMTCAGAKGDVVHGFVVRPAGPVEARPMLFWIHGGPMGAHADGWHWRWNAALAAAQGFTVVLPNPRGSTGYGQRFTNEVWGNTWGEACFADLMAFCDAACARADVDAERCIAMGGSFGGYMCNWIGTQTQRFKALISHAGLYHFPQFRGTTDDGEWFVWGLLIDPKADTGPGMNRYSPHAHMDTYRTPTLVIHGEKDYRVPISEALALYDALQRRDVPSELLVYPDENHWILKPWNIVDWNQRWAEFAHRYV
jgi:dipeptidyl aminopeptidase/acylaminoacyl peptidase